MRVVAFLSAAAAALACTAAFAAPNPSGAPREIVSEPAAAWLDARRPARDREMNRVGPRIKVRLRPNGDVRDAFFLTLC